MSRPLALVAAFVVATAGAVTAAPNERFWTAAPEGSGLASFQHASFPTTPEERFLRWNEPLSRDEFVRQVVNERLCFIPDRAFDLSGTLLGGSAGGWSRGTRLGLVAGSMAYVGGWLSGSDSWLFGSIGLATGFGIGLFTDVDWPPSFTVKWGEDRPLSFGMGWLQKPGGLPGARARFAGACDWYYTAGVSLAYTPPAIRDLRFDLFFDPFASPRASYGGAQIQFGF